MFQFGLKVWSTNRYYLEDAVKLYNQGIYSYLEIYVVPGSTECIDIWENLDIPIVIHAPHFRDGVNLAVKEKRAENLEKISETIMYADRLNSKDIIFHPGTCGNIEETCQQLKDIREPRIIIENKPYFVLRDDIIGNGSSPKDISFLIHELGLRFCLDIGHAICASNAAKIDPFVYLQSFLNLNPAMYHLTDGNYQSVHDSHKHFGDGDYPVKEILQLLPDNSRITNEAVKNSQDNLDDFVEDINYLTNIANCEC